MDCELTMSEILTDPLIHIMLKADGIALNDFADVIDNAVTRLKAQDRLSAMRALRAEANPATRNEPIHAAHQQHHRVVLGIAPAFA